MNANTDPIYMSIDPLNVVRDEVKPLSKRVLAQVKKGRTERAQLLDGSSLNQHLDRVLYALTHVSMTFDNEDDLIRCVRLLQWSDERMRARDDPHILWEWRKSFREGMTVEFTVGWYGKDCFYLRLRSAMDLGFWL